MQTVETQHDGADSPSLPIKNSSVRLPGGRTVLTLILGFSVLVVGGATFVGLASLKKPPAARLPAAKVYNVDVFSVSRTRLPTTITAYGTAMAEKDVVISAEVSGRIVSIGRDGKPRTDVSQPEKLLKVGQRISAGELLVQVDPTTYEQKYQQAGLLVQADQKEHALAMKQQANSRQLVKQAKASLKVYREEYDRYLKAKADGATVDSDITRARLELQRYQNLLTVAGNKLSLFPLQLEQILNRQEQHKKDREIAKTNLDHATIRAKFRGVLSEIYVQPGQYVRVGDPLVKLTNSAIVEIPVAVSLDDYNRLEPLVRKAKSLDQKPQVNLGESRDRPYLWTGRVVRTAPTADPLTRTVMVFLRVDNTLGHRSSSPVIPGMHYYASIQGAELSNVLCVPRDALVEGRIFIATKLQKKTVEIDGEFRTVWDGIAVSRKVTVLRTVQTLAILSSGINDGEYVILTNLDVIRKGAKVRFDSRQVRRLNDELKSPPNSP